MSPPGHSALGFLRQHRLLTPHRDASHPGAGVRVPGMMISTGEPSGDAGPAREMLRVAQGPRPLPGGRVGRGGGG